MQGFSIEYPSEEIPTQADNFSQIPEFFTWKFAEAVSSPKKLPNRRNGEQTSRKEEVQERYSFN